MLPNISIEKAQLLKQKIEEIVSKTSLRNKLIEKGYKVKKTYEWLNTKSLINSSLIQNFK